MGGRHLVQRARPLRDGAGRLAQGIYAHCRALLSDGQDAERSYREAVDRLGRTGFRPELARAHLLYGEWLRREARRADARAQLRTAHGVFAAIGMQAFAERARHELLATGETIRKRIVGPHDQLTPQEAQIAGLARAGLSNPEIAGQLFLSRAPSNTTWLRSSPSSRSPLAASSGRYCRTAAATGRRPDPDAGTGQAEPPPQAVSSPR
jgi:DNA-binding CsgD family transcriptional regulator